jgi:hypothetical protein
MTKTTWPARIFFTLPVLFLAFDVLVKLVAPGPVAEASAKLGMPAHLAVPIGLVLAACLALYVVRRTAPLLGSSSKTLESTSGAWHICGLLSTERLKGEEPLAGLNGQALRGASAIPLALRARCDPVSPQLPCSCSRIADTAAHLVDRVLPHAPYRQ